MADILDEGFGQPSTSFDLDTLFTTAPDATAPVPKGTTRNRAAITALLADTPEQAIENYQRFNTDAELGDTSFQEGLLDGVKQRTQEADLKGVMNVLADPNIPVDQKQNIIRGFKDSMYLKDTGTILQTNALTAPSKDENKVAEDARISTAEIMREMKDARTQIQGLTNAHIASLESRGVFGAVMDFLAVDVLPGGFVASVSKVDKALADQEGGRSVTETIKSLLPGSTITKLRNKLENLPPKEQVEFARKLKDAIAQNSGIVFGDDNQYAQFTLLDSIIAEGGYSTTQKWLDNITPLLDIIGVGALLKGGIRAARGAAKAADVIEGGAAAAVTAVEAQPSLARTLPEFSKEAQDNARALADLEKQKRDMVALSGNKADKGDIRGLREEIAGIKATPPINVEARTRELQGLGQKFKEAKAQALKEADEASLSKAQTVSRLENQIKTNAEAEKASAKIKELDRQIAELKKKVSAPSAMTEIASSIRRIEMNYPIRIENPASPAAILSQANPEQARGIFSAVFKSTEDSVAEALHGVGRVQAIANDVFPQISSEGRVTSKAFDIQRDVRQEVKDLAAASSSGIEFTAKERKAALANIVNDFKSVSGLEMNEVMSDFSMDGSRAFIGAVYGTPEGAWSSAQMAVDQAKLALRNWGIRDDEIEILAKRGLDHEPVKLEDVKNLEGNYLIRIKMPYDITANDLIINGENIMEAVDVKRNFLDRMSALTTSSKGSAASWIMDAASMLHPVYTGAASVASDVTARFDKFMLSKATEYTDKYDKLGKAQKAKVDSYIREANEHGIAFDQTDLLTRGFGPDEISALKSWRDFWDGHYYLENFDLVRSLNSQGFMRLESPNATLYAKPIAKDGTIAKLYDPSADKMVTLTREQMDDLYNSGGSYARLRRPETINGEQVEYIISRNNPNEYLRKVRDTDQILNYREGYYQIQYKAPKFVDEIITDSAGRITSRRAVAVAKNTDEAETFANGKRANAQNGEQYIVRSDERALSRGSDEYWDLNSSNGRIAQRHRGKLLEDSTGVNLLGDGSYVLDPIESATRAAKSIAGRTVARPMLETGKERFMRQYANLLPSDGMGGVKFPSKVGEIGEKGKHESSLVADARTTWMYLNYLENGYINSMDDFFKQTLATIGDVAGKASLTKTGKTLGASQVERAANLAATSGVSATHLTKAGVFTAYIASNPLRQWIVQTHQVVRTFAYNPEGWLKGKITKYATGFTLDKSGGGKFLSNDVKEFVKFMDESGLVDAVDRQNLVRGTLSTAADTTNKVVKTARAPVEFTRKVGFDVGEMGNLIGHAAAVYDRYKRLGRDLSKREVRAEAHSEIRALSYEMNFAGDMVYNQTAPAVILQFMQVPHKALLQASNRKIPVGIRMRMMAADLAMWGAPTATIAAIMGTDILPDNPDLREVFTDGIESLILNRTLSYIAGEDVGVDFSTLAPYELDGWAKMYDALLEGGLQAAVSNSPAGQLFLKDGGRVQNAMGSMGRLLGFQPDDAEDPETILSTLNEIARISSGWNNAIIARYILENGKRLDKYGNVIDPKVNNTEALAQLFGFATKDVREMYRISKEWSETSKTFKEDVLQVYNARRQILAEKLGSDDFMTRGKAIESLASHILEVFKDEPAAQQIIMNQMRMDLQGRDQQMMRKFIQVSQLKDKGTLLDDIRQMPVDESQKEEMFKRVEDVSNLRNFMFGED